MPHRRPALPYHRTGGILLHTEPPTRKKSPGEADISDCRDLPREDFVQLRAGDVEGAGDGPRPPGGLAAVELVRLEVRDLGVLDQPPGVRLANRVDVDPAGAVGVLGVGVHDVDVAEECMIALGGEPRAVHQQSGQQPGELRPRLQGERALHPPACPDRVADQLRHPRPNSTTSSRTSGSRPRPARPAPSRSIPTAEPGLRGPRGRSIPPGLDWPRVTDSRSASSPSEQRRRGRLGRRCSP